MLEATLGAVGGDGLPPQEPGVAAGESVDGVSLWHALIVSDAPKPCG